ncbi:hypothetical protein [Streptosporangium saharense]|uniref:hypothetical protein n=1 Tax=Streptosporangium saharense TaxID=1706840 RepID=UPI00343E492A
MPPATRDWNWRVRAVTVILGWTVAVGTVVIMLTTPAVVSPHALLLLLVWTLTVPLARTAWSAHQRALRARAATALRAYELGFLHEQDMVVPAPLR